MPATALRLVPIAAIHPLAAQPVLESAPLRHGFDRAQLSRFGDASWDLAPAVFRENARRCHVTVHFDGIDDPAIKTTLREFLYARLNHDMPGHRTRLPPASVRQLFNRTRRFLEFIAAKRGACNLNGVDQALLDGYVGHLEADCSRSRTQIAHLLEIVVDLHRYREHMPSGGLPLQPWQGRSPFRVAGAKRTSGENKTPRIPEEIISPLLTWALKYVTVFSSDILAARAELQALERHRDKLIARDAALTEEARRCRRTKRLKAYFSKRQTEGRGVPLWTTSHNGNMRIDPVTGAQTPPINAQLIHLQIGIDAQSEPAANVLLRKSNKDLLAAAIRTIGTEPGGMDTPISDDADTGQPWRRRFDAKAVLFEERMLQAACYIVCAYLTGMRDCEVQAMRAGCLTTRRSEDGLIERYVVQSTAYKRRDVRGQSESWISIEPVASAIKVLEQLTAHIRRQRGGDTLWRVLNDGQSSKEHVSSEIVRQLNTFRDHLNGQFGTSDAPIIPPAPDGKPWRITTRQFRRTVAWHIANRPFGTVAGKIQYKHASIAAYEGYAGSSRSGFRNEIERERALGQLDDILEYFDRHSAGEVLMGPAAARITREMQQAADTIEPLPGHISDPARLRTMLAHVARTLFVGVLSDCFFNPATALCLNGKPDQASPSMGQCRPDRCPNSCIASQHRPIWERAIADGETLLRTKRISSLQRNAIEQDVRRYRLAIRTNS